MKLVNTILFSDVHLGSPLARAYELLNALKEYHFKKLIIVGDMFEDLNFKHLTSTHWELLEHIGKVSRRGVEVVWIEGNHDSKFMEFMSHMIGIPARNEYYWEVNGRKFVALHGHQFDNFLSGNPFLGRLFASAYSLFQRSVTSHFIGFLSDKIADKWQRLSAQVAEMATTYAKKRNCDVIICGHTHFVDNIRKDGVEYYNLGSWNSKPSYLLAVEDTGNTHFEVIP
jgi:UDP-2,3-diacylglucosamine pyrophosphatase LpxH